MMGLAEIFRLVKLGANEVSLILQAAPALQRIAQSATPLISQVQQEAPQLVPLIKRMATELVQLADQDVKEESGRHQAAKPAGQPARGEKAESAVIKKLVGAEDRMTAEEHVLFQRASRVGLREGALTVEEEMHGTGGGGGTFRDTQG